MRAKFEFQRIPNAVALALAQKRLCSTPSASPLPSWASERELTRVRSISSRCAGGCGGWYSERDRLEFCLSEWYRSWDRGRTKACFCVSRKYREEERFGGGGERDMEIVDCVRRCACATVA